MVTKLKSRGKDFVLQLGSTKKILSSAEILYFVSENHKTFLITAQGKWAYDEPLRDIEKSLPSLEFMRIHRNSIINFSFLSRFSNKPPFSAVMKDNNSFPISRSRRSETLRRYDDFIRNENSLAKKIISAPRKKGTVIGDKIWSLRESDARRVIDMYPELALEMKRKLLLIAQTPQAYWLGEWNSDVFADLEKPLRQAQYANSIPVFVLYKAALREETYDRVFDMSFIEDYLSWVRSIASAIGSKPCIIILEPNALCSIEKREDQEQNNILISLLRGSVNILKQCSHLRVYIDAGHPKWLDASQISIYLARAGIEDADGFALNVANYVGDQDNIDYGCVISKYLGGKSFVIDTSRNGNPNLTNFDHWCNHPEASLGRTPTFKTDHPLVDGYLWIKPPGESDLFDRRCELTGSKFHLNHAIDLVDKTIQVEK